MKTYLLIVVYLTFFFVSCNKWKKPADVVFFMDIERTPTLGGQLTFSGGFIVMEQFDFEGRREKGDDVLFEKEFETGLTIPFDESQTIEELNFMIPQGSYDRVDIGFRTFDGSDVCIFVEGMYTYTGGGDMPFVFEFYDSEQFKIRAESIDDGNIILDKDVESPAKILLDPNHWFQPVPVSLFENATISNVNGVSMIVINKNENDNIYDLVLDRIDESALILFNY